MHLSEDSITTCFSFLYPVRTELWQSVIRTDALRAAGIVQIEGVSIRQIHSTERNSNSFAVVLHFFVFLLTGWKAVFEKRSLFEFQVLRLGSTIRGLDGFKVPSEVDWSSEKRCFEQRVLRKHRSVPVGLVRRDPVAAGVEVCRL